MLRARILLGGTWQSRFVRVVNLVSEAGDKHLTYRFFALGELEDFPDCNARRLCDRTSMNSATARRKCDRFDAMSDRQAKAGQIAGSQQFRFVLVPAMPDWPD